MKSEKKTGAARTQLAVRDEWWSDERIQSFLELESSNDETPAFHLLSKAYQGMIPEAFDRFVHFFNEAGHDINQVNSKGQSLLSIVSEHRNSAEYGDILSKRGAI